MLDANTTVVEVQYYCSDQVLDYVVHVIDDFDDPVDDAKINISIISDDSYISVMSTLTDGNGDATISLIPGQYYKVVISKTGYTTEDADWTPSENVRTKTFKLYNMEPSDETLWDDLEYSFSPSNRDQYDNFTFYYNMTSDTDSLEWMNLTVFYFNETSGSWIQVHSENVSTSSGTSLFNTTVNGTGMYGFQCSFKKTGYTSFVFGTSFFDETVFTYHIWGSGSDENVSWIDDGVERIVGESPVKVGETVVAYSALAIAMVSMFLLFSFSTRYAGFAIMSVAVVLGAFREPLHLMSDSVVNYLVIVVLFILGFMVLITMKKEKR
jgi:hypothetical protein